jgi:hypothetical protein
MQGVCGGCGRQQSPTCDLHRRDPQYRLTSKPVQADWVLTLFASVFARAGLRRRFACGRDPLRREDVAALNTTGNAVGRAGPALRARFQGSRGPALLRSQSWLAWE